MVYCMVFNASLDLVTQEPPVEEMQPSLTQIQLNSLSCLEADKENNPNDFDRSKLMEDTTPINQGTKSIMQ